ncbi:hypothetical protein [Paenibacillus sp. Soil766]|uniref:hypothetical protein n=1 Tax=Paenibacillus sp. Soil766 TaxID=1736404 RepID=UPI001F2EE9B1|nr:hypothetical protein [Paenibacillus sp. Soil766]
MKKTTLRSSRSRGLKAVFHRYPTSIRNEKADECEYDQSNGNPSGINGLEANKFEQSREERSADSPRNDAEHN